MRLAIISLAGAMLPAAAAAQIVTPPVAWEDTPEMTLRAPRGAIAAAVQAPAAMPVPTTRPLAGPARVTATSPAPALRPAPAARPIPVAGPGTRFAVTSPAPPLTAPGVRPPVVRQPLPYRRLTRGYSVSGVWATPRVEVRNYGRYGLYPPAYGDRWIRYYDDALLVDRGGVVRDDRSGLDWDQAGESWSEEDGVPVYVGRGDFQPDEEDYAFVESFDEPGTGQYAERDDYVEEAPAPLRPEPAYQPAPRAQGYAHHAEYGPPQPQVTCVVHQAYGAPRPCVHGSFDAGRHYPPGTVVTETIVTTRPVTTAHTYYVEREVRAAPRKTKRLVRKRAPVLYGEKG